MSEEEQVKLDKLATRFKRNITALNKTMDEVRCILPNAEVFFSGSGGVDAMVRANCDKDIYGGCVIQGDEDVIATESIHNADCGGL